MPQPIPLRLTESGEMFATGVPPAACDTETDQQAAIRYTVAATLDYTERVVTVRQQIDYRNDTGRALESLILYVPPNDQPGVFSLESVWIEGDSAPPESVLVGPRLTVPLPTALLPGCRQTLYLDYMLHPPRMGTGYFPRRGYFGYSDRQFNLGLWTVTIAYFDGETWFTPTSINIGEQGVFPAADFHVTLTVTHAPPGLTVVGPGMVRQRGTAWEFTLLAGRDLTISLSDQFHRSVAAAPNGVQVEVYTLDDAQPPQDATYDAPAHALITAAAAVELYADLYGDYPYERLVVLQSDFPDGMEFSGLVFVGGEWFRSYNGDPACYLTLITAHEVAHQWWYSIVANDQGAVPWLDEALATYSELVFLEENYPGLVDWWWRFRVDGYSPEGYVDSTVYQFDSLRAYINAVYLRGARLMHRLREVMGGEAFFAWLHDYVTAMRGRVAFPADLWATLPPDLREATFAPRAEYLRVPGRAE